MTILAFDTTQPLSSIALYRDGRLLIEQTIQVTGLHSDWLLPAIEESLGKAKVSLEQLTHIAVNLGPGSFAGIRVGLATAKGLKLASTANLVGITAFEILAAMTHNHTGHVAALLDARRNEVFLGCMSRDGATWNMKNPPCIASPEEAASMAMAMFGDQPFVATGDLPQEYWSRFSSVAPKVVVLPALASFASARYLAFSATTRSPLSTDEQDNLEPLYIRQSDAKLPSQPLQLER